MKTVYPKIVVCARMASSSVRKRRSARTDLRPYKVLQRLARGEEETDVSGTHFKMRKTVYPEIVDCARMASSSVCKRRFARTGFRPCKVLPVSNI
jgi:hypothetical protein